MPVFFFLLLFLGIIPATICAHAALLEPSNPGRFGTAEIINVSTPPP